MARYRDVRTISSPSIEIDPVELGSALAGRDGQLVVATDQGNNRLWVRESDTLVPVIEYELDPSDVNAHLQTLEAFTVAVDYATGVEVTSPLTIRNQAESDAFGTFKYLQDAVEALPHKFKHAITINIAAGTHMAKKNSADIGVLGAQTVILNPPSHHYDSGAFLTIQGAVTVLEADIAGTVSAQSFVRSSGSWTPGEFDKTYMKITSGASVNEIRLIDYNTEDTIFFAGRISTAGACVISLQKPGTVLSHRDPDGVAGMYGLYANRILGTLAFYDVDIGAIDDPVPASYCGPDRFLFYRCRHYGTLATNKVTDMMAHFLYVCIPATAGATWYAGMIIGSGARIQLLSSIVEALSAYAPAIYCSYSLSPAIYIQYSIIRLGASAVNKACIYIAGFSSVSLMFQASGSATAVLDGGGVGLGVSIATSSLLVTYGQYVSFVNCITCIKAQGVIASWPSIGHANSNGNTLAYELVDNSNIRIKTIKELGAASFATVDSVEVSTSTLSESGDTFIGPEGSSLGR